MGERHCVLISEEVKMRLFVDLDGTLAEFKPVDTLETLYEEGYFRNLKPQKSVVDAINFILRDSNIEVYILSSVLTDSRYALQEKNMWIDKFLPDIPKERRIFPPCGADKKLFIEGGVSTSDFLLDDYSVNLNSWEPPARGIKLMNGINGTKGSWRSEKLSMDKSAEELAMNIVNIMFGREHYRDEGPSLRHSDEEGDQEGDREGQEELSQNDERLHKRLRGR